MQRDVNKKSSHPSSRELADFVDGKLNRDRKAEITKHLIECDECSDVVALVMKYGEKKTHLNNDSKNEQKVVENINKPQVAPKDFVNNTDKKPQPTSQGSGSVGLGYANNWLYNERVRVIVLSGLVASVMLFLVMVKEDAKPPFIDFYTNATQTSFNSAVKASEIKDIKKANQEINNFLIKIVKSTDMSYLKEFNLAEEKLKEKEFDDARELYQMAMNMVEDMPNLDKRERDKQNIVIGYKILLLSKAEADNESFNEYRDKLRDDVRRFKKRWIEPSN